MVVIVVCICLQLQQLLTNQYDEDRTSTIVVSIKAASIPFYPEEVYDDDD
jgi:hypothetical protein